MTGEMRILIAFVSFFAGFGGYQLWQIEARRIADDEHTQEMERLYREFPLRPGAGPSLPCERPDCSNAPTAPRWNLDPLPVIPGPMSYVMLRGQERIDVPRDVMLQLRLQEAQSISEEQLAEIRKAMRGI